MTQRVYSLQSTVFRKSSLRCISVHGSRFTVHGDSGILQSSAFSLQPSEDNACCP